MKILFGVFVASLVVGVCSTYAAEDGLVKKALGLQAAGLDLSKPMDLYIEAKEVDDVRGYSYGGGDKKPAMTVHWEFGVKMVLRAGTASFKCEFRKPNGEHEFTLGQPVGAPPWAVVKGEIQKGDIMADWQLARRAFGPRLYAAILNVCSLVPLAKDPNAVPGVVEKVEIQGREDLRFRRLPISAGDLTMDALLWDSQPALVGVRVQKDTAGTFCVFDDFKKAGGLLFPMKWVLYSWYDKDKPEYGTTTTLTKVEVLHLPDSAYAAENALKPVKPKEAETVK